MKKLLPLIYFFTIVSFVVNSQTIVSTSPENKNVILEEFTGVNCVYCPQGHAIAESIKNNNPDDVFLINIHTGSFATPSGDQPDFTTSFGSALASQSNLTGYPSGTVNRHVFTGLGMQAGSTAMSRGKWQTAANQILQQNAYVNVSTQAEVNVATRELTVLVEAYYTGNSNNTTNKLNLALLQNNTKGPQVGGNMGDNYNHQHRLVHLLTGQWGEDITNTSQGTFVSKTYTYTIPNEYKDIMVALGDLEVVAYIAEGNQEIINGSGAQVSVNSTYTNEIGLLSTNDINDTCDDSVTPEITIANLGNNTLNSLDINYSINNGQSYTYSWTGSLDLGKFETISLPTQNFSVQQNNIVEISIASDEDTSNNNGIINFNKSNEGTRNITVDVRIDNYPTEMTWEILDGSDQVVASGGPYIGSVNGGGQDAFTTKSYSITLPQADCYSVKLIDSYGDGWSAWNSSVPAAGFDVYSNGNLLFSVDGTNFGSEIEYTGVFSANSTLDVNNEKMDNISIYPNPTNGKLFVTNLENFDIQIFDVKGVSVYQDTNLNSANSINLDHLKTGVYFVNLRSENNNKNIKLLIE